MAALITRDPTKTLPDWVRKVDQNGVILTTEWQIVTASL
jgi:hypothetical protein